MDRQVKRQEEVRAKALQTQLAMFDDDRQAFLAWFAEQNDSTFLAYYGQWKGLPQFWYIPNTDEHCQAMVQSHDGESVNCHIPPEKDEPFCILHKEKRD